MEDLTARSAEEKAADSILDQQYMDGKGDDDQHIDFESKIEEISPNKRYVRFGEVISRTENIKVSYRGFDTRNGIEVAWHAIDLSGLNDAEQEEVAKSANSLKALDSKFIAQYLSIWVDDEPRRLIIITALLESLKEFIGKVRILRWRIVKKWCKQIVRGLAYLHEHNPRIVHRNLSCEYVYINGGEGQLKIGNTWLAAILEEDSDRISMSETMTKHSQIIGSPAYNAPEIFDKRPLDTKADVYSLGMCLIEIITREEPYVECKGVYSRIAKLKMMGVPPLGLMRVTNSAASQFIQQCLKTNPEERPTADELRRHPFLESTADDDEEATLGPMPELPNKHADITVEDLCKLSSSLNLSLGKLKESDPTPVQHRRSTADELVSTNGSTPFLPSGPPVKGRMNLDGGSKDDHACVSLLACCSADSNSPATDGHGQFHKLRDMDSSKSLHSVNSFDSTSPGRNNSFSDLPSIQRNHSAPMEALLLNIETASANVVESTSDRRQTPRIGGKSRFGKEFAALYKGEDVREDKGVQDGRRPAGSDVEDDLALSPTVVVATAEQPSLAMVGVRVPLASTSGPDENMLVAVQLKIGKEHTFDGMGREVEFSFNPGCDDYQVVAKEMIEELVLNMPIDSLAKAIELQVASCSKSASRTTEAAVAVDEPLVQSDQSQLTADGPTINISTSTPSGMGTHAFPSDQQPTGDAGNMDAVNSDRLMAAPVDPLLIDSNDNDVPAESSRTLSPDACMVPSITPEIAPPKSTEKVIHIVGSIPMSGAVQERQIILTGSSFVTTDPQPTAATSAVVDLDASVKDSGAPQDSVGGSIDQVAANQIESDEDDDGTRDEEDAFIMQEISRIDKEAGSAKRVFEQRILTHKRIQATLEEDIIAEQLDYQEKLEAVKKKIEQNKRKLEEEKHKLQSDFENQMAALRAEKRAMMREERFFFLEKVAAGHTSSIDEYSNDSNNRMDER